MTPQRPVLMAMLTLLVTLPSAVAAQISESDQKIVTALLELNRDTCDPRVVEIVEQVRFSESESLQDWAMDYLATRTEVDVSPHALAIMRDRMLIGRGHEQMYGTQQEEAHWSSDADAQFNRNRDDLGLVEVELERLVRADMARNSFSGIHLDTNLYQCRTAQDGGKLREELRSLTQASNEKRWAWESEGFPAGTTAAAEAREQDEVAARWLAQVRKEWARIEEAGLKRREVFEAFGLLQHSRDASLMFAYFPFIARMVIEGTLPRTNYALYVDRILLFTGYPQVYGTQGEGDGTGTAQSKKMEGGVQEENARRAVFYLKSQ